MEKVNDLIDPRKLDLEVREDKVTGPYIQGLTEIYCINE